ncbi:SKA complex subunit 2 isoform X2 [Genypterus blacodes]|uniref:SKA complex subunit 2 isoform X2 n=1 Tax=Genypterus blacodes TaxID=154954 RepID=UPI003F757E0D
MEPAVEKLEALFQKSEAELDYMEKRLKLNLVTQAAENGSDGPVTQNPALVLEKLKVMKARHAELSAQLTQITAAQEESMGAIRRNLQSITELIHSAHNTAAVTVNPLTESQKLAAEELASAVAVPWLPQCDKDGGAEHEGH